MFQRVIDTDNFERVLAEIRTSAERYFDFSGTDFKTLGLTKLSAVFAALYSLPHTFFLKLNNCKIDEERLGNRSQLEELTLGLSTTKNMERFEFIRSLSPDCSQSEEVLFKIAESLLKNHEIKSIRLDGYKVTPPAVCDVLKSHPTALYVFVDGLSRLNRPYVNSGLFRPAANESVSNDSELFSSVRQKRCK